MSRLVRFSVAIEEELMDRFEALLARGGQANRSEAIRDLIRRRLADDALTDGTQEAVGTVTLVYDHARRSLSDQIVEAGHQHHDVIVATMHVHLDERDCLEVVALRGQADEVRHVGESLAAMKGVRDGRLVLTAAAATATRR
jgi:CopG family nickel-responsive transcriptional regulator